LIKVIFENVNGISLLLVKVVVKHECEYLVIITYRLEYGT